MGDSNRRHADQAAKDVIAEERGRHRRGGAPLDVAARARQRQREKDQAEYEADLLPLIKKRDKKKVLEAMQRLGASAESMARVEQLWAKLPPKPF